MTLVSLGRTGEAEGWVDRASSAARADPRPGLVRRLEMWRGLLAGAGGDAGGLIEHLERAAELGAEHSSPAGRCEALAHLAMETAKLGLATGDDALLERSEQAVGEVRALLSTLTGRMPWEAMAHAASALVALARQQPDRAADEGRSALEILEPRFNRTHYLDVLWAAGRALIPSGAPEAADLAKEILEDLTFIDLTTADPEVMADWFSMGVHRELAELAGYQPMDPSAKQAAPDGLEEDEVELLRLLTAGSGDPEIASRLGRPEVEVSERVEALLNKLGVESREGATQFALKAGIT